jgi:hypothetical protein
MQNLGLSPGFLLCFSFSVKPVSIGLLLRPVLLWVFASLTVLYAKLWGKLPILNLAQSCTATPHVLLSFAQSHSVSLSLAQSRSALLNIKSNQPQAAHSPLSLAHGPVSGISSSSEQPRLACIPCLTKCCHVHSNLSGTP